ncbi:MAG: DUF1588 domain-containing protein [Archangiaceae bacterium]|nr:DUF1588 domain-containing protein [Archangiaceae bacterium]
MRPRTRALLLLVCACTGTIETPEPHVVVPPVVTVTVPAGGETCSELGLPGAPVPMRRLNRTHVEQTVHQVLGIDVALPVTDERLFTYRSNVSSPVDSQQVQGYFDWAEAVVKKVSLAPCTASGCETWLFDELAPRFFRRPLDPEQRARYRGLFEAGTAQGRSRLEGAQWVLEAMLQSPSFLYLDEPTSDEGLLDGYAVAARLALMLWGHNPDDWLLGLAATGRLSTAEGVRQTARKMLRDPRSERGLEAFVSQWLELERLEQVNARPDLVALGTPLLTAMAREPVDTFRLSTLQGDGLAALLTTPRTAAAPALVAYYGPDALSTVDGVTQLNPLRRAGLLTSPGVMASLAHAESTSPTLRGYAVLANLMCKPPPPPPAGVNVNLPPPVPGLTTRQRLERHFSDESCGSCHRAMDGMGFAFEHFDALGKWRDTEGGMAIDDSSSFKMGGEQITIHGSIELSKMLAGRREVAECFARQWTRYATGIPEQAPVACYMRELADGVLQSNGLERLILSLASSEYVRRGAAQ